MMRSLYCVVVLSLAFSGCAKPTAEESLKLAKEAYEQARVAVDSLGRQADNAKTFAEPIQLFTKLAEDHPDSPQGGEALFMVATIRNNHTREFPKAIESYRQYVTRFPQGERAPISLFLMGYLYNNELRQYDSAAAVYRRFLDQFPTNELALSAQFELQTLGKEPEELVPPEPTVAAVPPKTGAQTKRSPK